MNKDAISPTPSPTATTREPTDYLFVGAGLAGLACARTLTLTSAGDPKPPTLRLLDKGRGVGGRCATRPLSRNDAAARADHGLPFLTAHGERMVAFVAEGAADGWLVPWTNASEDDLPRWVAPDGMNQVAKRLAEGLSIETSATVTRLTRDAESGLYAAIVAETGAVYQARRLVLNLPPTQLAALLRTSEGASIAPPDFFAFLAPVRHAPTWTLLARLVPSDAHAPWSDRIFVDHPVLSYIVRDESKRNAGDAAPVLVAHATPEWSRAHLEEDAAQIADALKNAVQEALNGTLVFEIVQAHRWRYALPEIFYPAPYAHFAERGLGVCGDWFRALPHITDKPARAGVSGDSAENALASGWALAERIRSEP